MTTRVNVEGSSLVLSSGTKDKQEIRGATRAETPQTITASVHCALPVAELHGLGGSCSLIQQGGIGHGHACDVTDHGLVVEERLQATLGHFRLVGRVLSHPENKTGTMRTEPVRKTIAHGGWH